MLYAKRCCCMAYGLQTPHDQDTHRSSPLMKDNAKKILRTCMNNEADYVVLPHYGLIADWFVRYWELHNLVLEHFDEEPYEEPLKEFYEKPGE